METLTLPSGTVHFPGEPKPMESNNWEQRFEELMPDRNTTDDVVLKPYIKSFISQELEKAYRKGYDTCLALTVEAREEGIAQGRQEVLERGGNFIKYHEGINDQLTRTLQIIEEMNEEHPQFCAKRGSQYKQCCACLLEALKEKLQSIN